MEVIAKVFAEQWIFMLLAVAVVALTFFVKKKATDYYQAYLRGGLVLMVVATVIMALLFHLPDLFLLIPIIIMCCELFGYNVTGKIVGVLFVDFILIQFDYRLVTNETAMTVIFYALQIASAICIGIIMDKYMREVAASNKNGKEIPNNDEQKNDTDDNIDVASLFDITKDNSSVFDNDDLDDTIEKIMNSIEE